MSLACPPWGPGEGTPTAPGNRLERGWAGMQRGEAAVPSTCPKQCFGINFSASQTSRHLSPHIKPGVGGSVWSFVPQKTAQQGQGPAPSDRSVEGQQRSNPEGGAGLPGVSSACGGQLGLRGSGVGLQARPPGSQRPSPSSWPSASPNPPGRLAQATPLPPSLRSLHPSALCLLC